MSYGYSAMGDIEPTGLFRESTRYATATVASLLATASDWHDEIFGAPIPTNAQEISDATHKEIDKGQLSRAAARSFWDRRFGKNGWRAVIRFGLWQGEKFRPIDDGKRSGHNAAQEIREKVHTCPVSFPALVALYALRYVPAIWPWWFSLKLEQKIYKMHIEVAQLMRRASPPPTDVALYGMPAHVWMAA